MGKSFVNVIDCSMTKDAEKFIVIILRLSYLGYRNWGRELMFSTKRIILFQFTSQNIV